MSGFGFLVRSLAAAVIVCAAGTAAAQDVGDFYKDKRIRMIVGSGPGGGYDVYARLVARHLGRHIPGNPAFQVQNMEGAGSVVATNYVVNVAPKDGTVIGAIQREIALVQLMGQPGPKYEARTINWLGSLLSEPGVCSVATRTGISSFADLFQREFVFGGTGPNVTEFFPAMFHNLLRAPVKLIKGYPATPQIHLAIQRGEVDGICQSWSSFKEQAAAMLKDGTIRPVVQMSISPQPELRAMGVPMIFDFITAERAQAGMTVEDVRNYFHLVLAAGAMGRPFMLAPEVPGARVAAMRKAFTAVTGDAEFLNDAKKQRREIDFVSGEDIQAIVTQMAAVPPGKLAQLDELMKFTGKTEQAKIEPVRHTGKVTATQGEGRQIVISHQGKDVTANVSASATKVMIGGKAAKRDQVTAGMTCTFVYAGPGTQAEEVSCNN